MTPITHHPPGTPCWVDLSSKDPEAARAFYAGLLGWTYDILGPEMGNYALCKKDGVIVGGLGGIMPGTDAPSAWTLYFSSENLEESIEVLKTNGGRVVFGPMDIPQMGRQLVAMDSAGAVFGLWQPQGFIGSGLWGEPGTPAWAEVNTRESEKIRDFYSTLLGLEGRPMPGMAYFTLHPAGAEKAAVGVLQMDKHWPADLPAHWMVYFAVESLDDSLQRLKELGGQQCVPPFDTPYGRMSVVNDPTGAVLTLIQR